MRKKKIKILRGFTLVTLMVSIAISPIVIFGVGVVLVDSQKSWQRMYNRTYSSIVIESYVARKTFDAVIRKASRDKFLLDDAGTWIEIYYYADSTSTVIDRYARLYYEESNDPNIPRGNLDIEYGQ